MVGIPLFVDWAVPFLRSLRESRDADAQNGRAAFRKLVKRGANPSVFLPAIHNLVEIAFDLALPILKRRHPGAHEQRLLLARTTVATLVEVIETRRDLAIRSDELNHHICRGAGLLETPLSFQSIGVLLNQPSNDTLCADILEQEVLPVWQQTASRDLRSVTPRFLLRFLHRYLTVTTGSAHTADLADLLNAALSISAEMPKTGNANVKTRMVVALKGRRRGRSTSGPQDDPLDSSWIATVVSRLPGEHQGASAAVEQWAKRSAARGPWRRLNNDDSDFAMGIDSLMSEPKRTKQ